MKKIISLIIVICLTVSLSVVPAQASTDKTAPLINSIEVLNPQITEGSEEMLRMRIDLIEDGSGILAHTFAVENLSTGDVY